MNITPSIKAGRMIKVGSGHDSCQIGDDEDQVRPGVNSSPTRLLQK